MRSQQILTCFSVCSFGICLEGAKALFEAFILEVTGYNGVHVSLLQVELAISITTAATCHFASLIKWHIEVDLGLDIVIEHVAKTLYGLIVLAIVALDTFSGTLKKLDGLIDTHVGLLLDLRLLLFDVFLCSCQLLQFVLMLLDLALALFEILVDTLKQCKHIATFFRDLRLTFRLKQLLKLAKFVILE